MISPLESNVVNSDTLVKEITIGISMGIIMFWLCEFDSLFK